MSTRTPATGVQPKELEQWVLVNHDEHLVRYQYGTINCTPAYHQFSPVRGICYEVIPVRYARSRIIAFSFRKSIVLRVSLTNVEFVTEDGVIFCSYFVILQKNITEQQAVSIWNIRCWHDGLKLSVPQFIQFTVLKMKLLSQNKF